MLLFFMFKVKLYLRRSQVNLFDKLLQYAENEYIENMQKSLSKMQDFLIKKGVSSSFREVKELPRIEIKGTAENGKERLLLKDVRDRFDVNVFECSVGFNTYYPIIKKGTIKFTTKENGSFYTVFTVISETADEFDLQLYEYTFYNQVFYLKQILTVRKISKKNPWSLLDCTQLYQSTIENFFFNSYSRKQLSAFTEEELDFIKDVNFKDIDTIACISQVLATFRVVNFIYESSRQLNINFYDNEYFKLKYWNKDLLSDFSSISKPKNTADYRYIEEIINIENGIEILKPHSLEFVIKEIVHRTQSLCLYCAVGFVFKSGLKLLSPIWDELSHSGHECTLIVGALQNYDSDISNNRIDKATVKFINNMLSEKKISLYTHKHSFYHGKFYYMCNKNKAYIIIGSTNISKSAFRNNYELDVLYVTDKNSIIDNQFREWYYSLKDKCDEIKSLNEDCFADYDWDSELDAFNSIKNHIISKREAMQKINQLTDEDTKYRLGLWMEKNPTAIYDDIEIGAFKDKKYSLFYYSSTRLAVFESFMPNNAYYAFRINNNLPELLDNISKMAKEEMAFSKFYIKKGYHTLSHDNLKKKVDSFFID